MDVLPSPQPCAVGEDDLNQTENQKRTSYAAAVATAVNGIHTVKTSKLEICPVSFQNGMPIVEFTVDEVNSFTREKGLHQAVVIKFSYGKPPMQELRQILPNLLKVKGNCNIGQLEYRHILLRFDLFEYYVNVVSRSSGYVQSKGDNFFFRTFTWTMGFNPREETPKAVVWISFPDLPANLFARKTLMTIASAVGKPLDVDKATKDRTRPSMARVKVLINLLDNHPKNVKINILDAKSGKLVEYDQQIVIENPPTYCTYCNHQGHDVKSCRWYSKDRQGKAAQNSESEDRCSMDKTGRDAREILNEISARRRLDNIQLPKKVYAVKNHNSGANEDATDSLTGTCPDNTQADKCLKELKDKEVLSSVEPKSVQQLEILNTDQQIVFDNLPSYCTFCYHQGHEKKACRWISEDSCEKEAADKDQAGRGSRCMRDAREILDVIHAGRRKECGTGGPIINKDTAVVSNTADRPYVLGQISSKTPLANQIQKSTGFPVKNNSNKPAVHTQFSNLAEIHYKDSLELVDCRQKHPDNSNSNSDNALDGQLIERDGQKLKGIVQKKVMPTDSHEDPVTVNEVDDPAGENHLIAESTQDDQLIDRNRQRIRDSVMSPDTTEVNVPVRESVSDLLCTIGNTVPLKNHNVDTEKFLGIHSDVDSAGENQLLADNTHDDQLIERDGQMPKGIMQQLVVESAGENLVYSDCMQAEQFSENEDPDHVARTSKGLDHNKKDFVGQNPQSAENVQQDSNQVAAVHFESDYVLKSNDEMMPTMFVAHQAADIDEAVNSIVKAAVIEHTVASSQQQNDIRQAAINQQKEDEERYRLKGKAVAIYTPVPGKKKINFHMGLRINDYTPPRQSETNWDREVGAGNHLYEEGEEEDYINQCRADVYIKGDISPMHSAKIKKANQKERSWDGNTVEIRKPPMRNAKLKQAAQANFPKSNRLKNKS